MNKKILNFLEFLKKIFGKTEISWKSLIIFAVLIGIIVGVFARIPFLENTSFQDIAIVLDAWIILAIFIIANAKTRKEAILKTFVFFLISQPLIYLIEVSINTVFFGADFFAQLIEYFNNYYFHGGNWFLWTLLTIPGAAIAFEIKEDNIFAPIILAVATGFLSFVGSFGVLNSVFKTFPNHILNGIICLFFGFVLGIVVLKTKKQKIINLAITGGLALVGIASFIVINCFNLPKTYNIEYAEGTTISEIISSDDSLVKIEIVDGGRKINFTSTGNYGVSEIKLRDSNDSPHLYLVESSKDAFFVSEL